MVQGHDDASNLGNMVLAGSELTFFIAAEVAGPIVAYLAYYALKAKRKADARLVESGEDAYLLEEESRPVETVADQIQPLEY